MDAADLDVGRFWDPFFWETYELLPSDVKSHLWLCIIVRKGVKWIKCKRPWSRRSGRK